MKDKVNDIIMRIANSDSSVTIKIDNNTSLKNDLGLDSLSLAELTVYIEDEFGIDIFEDGIVETVGEIYEKLNIN
jgi:acyl carrier protein